jgi:hypothetical protein
LMQLSVTTNAMTYPSVDRLNVNTILPQTQSPIPHALEAGCGQDFSLRLNSTK